MPETMEKMCIFCKHSDFSQADRAYIRLTNKPLVFECLYGSYYTPAHKYRHKFDQIAHKERLSTQKHACINFRPCPKFS